MGTGGEEGALAACRGSLPSDDESLIKAKNPAFPIHASQISGGSKTDIHHALCTSAVWRGEPTGEAGIPCQRHMPDRVPLLSPTLPKQERQKAAMSAFRQPKSNDSRRRGCIFTSGQGIDLEPRHTTKVRASLFPPAEALRLLSNCQLPSQTVSTLRYLK